MERKYVGGVIMKKETIEVDCRKCKNCTGVSCKAYNTDIPDIAVKKCADDNFKNYKCN